MADKKKFAYMSSNEWLGDATTHFMKTGNALRAEDNGCLTSISSLIPKNINGVKVEYDISYDTKDHTIRGYKYTDLLTKAIMISPCNTVVTHKIYLEVIRKGKTPTGEEVVRKLREGMTDKYLLDDDEEFDDLETLIILPGTNLIVKDYADMTKVDEILRTEPGAYVKLHPITAKAWATNLKKRWGNRVIDSDVALYPLIRQAKKTYFCTSSETGFVSLLMGKKMGSIDNKEKPQNGNFQTLYRALSTPVEGMTLLDKFTAIVSHPESGFLTVYHADIEQRVKAYFENTAKYKHV